MEWSCKSPLKLFWTDPYYAPDKFYEHKKNGVPTGEKTLLKKAHNSYRTKVCKFNTDHLELINGEWIPIDKKEVSNHCDLVSRTFIPISCGQCMPCRLQKSREWANRLMLEGLDYSDNQKWFITLTYDDENVPFNTYFDENGQEHISLTLRKRDFQLFIKRLRKWSKNKLRFYLAGEYGEETFRPHGHSIIFGLELDSEKLPVWKNTNLGFTLFESLEIEEIWNKGRVVVSPVSWDTACYVSRYVTKKLNGAAAEAYKELHIEPEFSLMSRKPGIGKNWALKHEDQVLNGTCYGPGQDGGISFSSPRYFRNLFAIDDELEMCYNQAIVQDRIEDKTELIKEVNSLARSDIMRYFESSYDQVINKVGILRRNRITDC